MLKAIWEFFDLNIKVNAGPTGSDHRIQLATAALLIEVARMDTQIHEGERQAVLDSLRGKFGLADQEASSLVALAEAEAAQATDYFQFTSLINQHFTQEQKIRIIEHLWEVAYTDSKLDMYEEHFIRKIADLLHVPRAQYIATKLRVRDTAR